MARLDQTTRPVKSARCELHLTIGDTVYGVDPIPAGFAGSKAFRLSKTTGEVYDVVRTDLGLVECSCPQYEFRLRGNSISMCKHGVGLVSMGLLDAPYPMPRPSLHADFND